MPQWMHITLAQVIRGEPINQSLPSRQRLHPTPHRERKTSMKFNAKTLAWAAVLAIAFLFASASPVQAQQCSSICNANVDCSTSCQTGPPFFDPTTCGEAGFDCCNTTVTRTLYCTGQFLKPDTVCVQVERDLVTTTCGSNSSTVIDGSRQRSDPGGTCTSCPTQHTPGCEDIVSQVCPNP